MLSLRLRVHIGFLLPTCFIGGKLFSKDTVFQAHLSGKKHISAEGAIFQQYKEISLNEARIDKLGDLLGEQIVNTKSYIEKKLSLSTEERLVSQYTTFP